MVFSHAPRAVPAFDPERPAKNNLPANLLGVVAATLAATALETLCLVNYGFEWQVFACVLLLAAVLTHLLHKDTKYIGLCMLISVILAVSLAYVPWNENSKWKRRIEDRLNDHESRLEYLEKNVTLLYATTMPSTPPDEFAKAGSIQNISHSVEVLLNTSMPCTLPDEFRQIINQTSITNVIVDAAKEDVLQWTAEYWKEEDKSRKYGLDVLLESSGGRIVKGETDRGLQRDLRDDLSPVEKLLAATSKEAETRAMNAINGDLGRMNYWGFAGRDGYLTVETVETVCPWTVSVMFPLKEVYPKREHAPTNYTVLGRSKNGPWKDLASCSYDANADMAEQFCHVTGCDAPVNTFKFHFFDTNEADRTVVFGVSAYVKFAS